ncbi:hypothetical protein KW800_02365 [Candidatus Parcubacteria bacterium]|nr:hypothetical protein [Candidatus Parcubacteria bacterium]
MSRITNRFMSIPLGLSLLAMAATANAQVAQPMVGIQLLSSGLTSPLVASSTGATIARLVLDTTGSPEAVRISSLPFALSLGNGAVASTLTNCRVANESNSGVNLSTPTGSTSGLVSGLNTVTLSSPLVLQAGTVTTLDLVCDPSAGLVTGGTFTVSVNTANVAATGNSTGLPAVVTVRGATPVVIPPVIIPTVPNTGAGGDASTNVALLFGAITLAVAGIALTRKTAQAR